MRTWSGFLMVFRLLAFGTAWGVGPPCGAARAASAATEADAAIKHGVELRRRGDDLRALDEFQRAHSLQRSGRALAQIGFAEQALGRWREAEEHLGLALADTSDAWVRRYREVIERSRAVVAGHLGSLEVLGGPEGAELRIDGRPVGRLPLAQPVRVAAGHIGIQLVAEGHLPAARPVTIAAGQLARETMTLQKIEPPPLAAPQITPAPRPVARAPLPPATALPEIVAAGRAPEDPGGWQRTAAWVGGGAAVLFAGAAVVGLVARGHYADRVDVALRDGGCAQHGDQFTGDGARDCAVAATDRDQAATVALVSGGVAGVLALASTILFVAAPRADAQAGSRLGSVAARARFTCAPVGGGVVLQCGGRF
jgi:hypothetical protein